MRQHLPRRGSPFFRVRLFRRLQTIQESEQEENYNNNDDDQLSLCTTTNTSHNNSSNITRKLPFSPNVIKKWINLTLLFSFALLPCGDAGIEATAGVDVAVWNELAVLRLQQQNQHQPIIDDVLFWSNFEMTVDAATHALGPLQSLLLRGGAIELSTTTTDSNFYDYTDEEYSGNSNSDDDNDEAEEKLRGVPPPYVIQDEELEDDNDDNNRSSESVFSFSSWKWRTSRQQQRQQEQTSTSSSSSQSSHSSLASQTQQLQSQFSSFLQSNTEKSSSTSSASGITYSNKDKMIFRLYQVGDGSERDPDNIPTRYMAMQNHKRPFALKALHATLDWRAQHKIDTILTQPHPKFDICKTVFPHAFVGRHKIGGASSSNPADNHVIFLQRPALIDMQAAKRNHLSQQELLMHYVYVNEYLWQILDGHSPLGTMISLLDLTGLHYKMLKQTDYLSFLKVFVSTMDSHYPQRAHKTLILNAPKWFNLLYRMVSPIMRESTKARIEILTKGAKQDAALYKYLGSKHAKELVPASFWSTTTTSSSKQVQQPVEELPMNDMERDLREFTLARLRDAGQKMLPVT